MEEEVPWWRISRNTRTRSYERTRVTGSTSSEFLSSRSVNVAGDTSTRTFLSVGRHVGDHDEGLPWSSCTVYAYHSFHLLFHPTQR